MEDYEKYKEALERAKKLLKNMKEGEYFASMEDIRIIFPELAESEDERIREEMITAFSRLEEDSTLCGVSYNYKKWIAWLEKQGTPAKVSEEEQNRDAKVVLTSCAMSFIKYLDAHKYESKMCVSNWECEDIENAFHNAMWDRLHRYYCKYIEKQGEQKPVDKVEPFDKYKGLTDFERTLADICIGWIGEELGWKQYIKDNADVLLEIAIKMFNSIQDAPFEQKPVWSEEDMSKVQRICKYLNEAKKYYADITEVRECMDWLKSLKDRIGG